MTIELDFDVAERLAKTKWFGSDFRLLADACRDAVDGGVAVTEEQLADLKDRIEGLAAQFEQRRDAAIDQVERFRADADRAVAESYRNAAADLRNLANNIKNNEGE